ncbi:MAG: transcription termination factor Rho, partial [bacterium]
MSVISRSALESSSLADLHEISSELGLDGYRRLRKADLVLAIIERQGGDADADADAAPDADDVAVAVADADTGTGADVDSDDKPARRSRRGGRGRSRTRDRDPGDVDDDDGAPAEPAAAPSARSTRPPRVSRENGAARDRGDRERGGDRDRDRSGDRDRGGDHDRERGDRDRGGDRDRDRAPASAEEREVSGTVELLPNGSGFLRVSPPEPSDDDVYISAAQVRRCELVSGDEVAGPVRAPRRSERYPSLIRVDTINGRSADAVSEGTKYDDLPCSYATERVALNSDDPTLKAIEWLTPFGRGSRVAIV